MRIPKPWFRKQTGCYYVQFGGRQINLGSVAKTARAKYEKLLREHGLSEPADIKIQDLVDLFLKWSREEHEPDTQDWYQRFLQGFTSRYGKLMLSQLRPYMVSNWARRDSWSPATRRCGIVCVKRLVKWAVTEGYASGDPLKALQIPSTVRRERVLSSEERKTLICSVRGGFKRFLWALLESGARPGEVARVSAAELEGDTWVFQKHKTAKKTGRPRVVYLIPPLVRLCEKLVAENPEGPIFRNRFGRPWTRNAIRIRFRNLRKKLNLKGVVAYTARHSFCTDGLEKGVPIATMSELLGHSSTRMVSAHYNHLHERKEHLRQAAKQARS